MIYISEDYMFNSSPPTKDISSFPKIKLLKHNGLVRDINSEANVLLSSKINEQIDIMLENRAYMFIVNSLRCKIQGNYGDYASNVLINNDTYSDETNIGQLIITKVMSRSIRKENIISALEKMGKTPYDIEEKIDKLSTKAQYVIDFDTSGALNDSVLKDIEKIQSKFYEDLKMIKSSNDENSYISLSIKYIKECELKCENYQHAYNRVKQLFEMGRSNGFPLHYSYKRLTLIWISISTITSFDTRIREYFKATNMKDYDEYILKLSEVQNEKNEFRYMYSLNGYD